MPATYNPGVPTGDVDLDQDYLNLQQNATALNTIFSVDHLPFSDRTDQQGFHTSIHLVPTQTGTYPPTVPTKLEGYGQLFSATVNDGVGTGQALFWLCQNASGATQLAQMTMNFTPGSSSTKGSTYLPGNPVSGSKSGLVFQFGNGTGLITGNTDVVFDRPFPNACLFVVATPHYGTNAGSGYNFAVNNLQKDKFKFYQSSNTLNTDCYYMAIGH